ncbi:hypothetical protein [Chryseobacterium turcicum]|uniref:Uncharacterized protein n=1 Tax=Chryseobacterium turcicum TaxID=2898076 RepID=A0A9Q3V4Y6_9FLAO|nr:hypothetical protein [Chryseobacterium turcicum]MCD1118869.1 hypothetical protein [Chryseobacterium turcicum]
MNWAEVLYGDIKGLKENKIKILKLKKEDKVLRTVEVTSDNSIIVKDSLTEVYFRFNHQNRLFSINSFRNKQKQEFKLIFKDNFINGISRLVDENRIKFYSQWSKVSFNNFSYEEKETYSFDKNKNDSLNVFREKYFFNKENSDLSYKETYQNGKVWNKKYFNNTEVKKEIFTDYYTIDSILQKNNKVTKYHFENYPNHQNIEIENDSILTIHKKMGKMISEKLEYASVPFREILYDEHEKVKEKIIYINYQNSFNEWVLWEEIKYDGKGKRLSRKFPNKDTYKLKDGTLVYRKNMNRVRTYTITCSLKRNSSFNYLQSYSTSILFSIKWAKNFTDNFDTYSIEEDEELVYGMLDFSANGTAKIRDNYSVSTDVKNELVRTSKSMTRNGRILKYFNDLEVEAETISGKKYNINLTENTSLLSFPIHTFLIKEEY